VSSDVLLKEAREVIAENDPALAMIEECSLNLLQLMREYPEAVLIDFFYFFVYTYSNYQT
jgi:hypothetical protein